MLGFLPDHASAEEEAEWVVNRLVENDIRSQPEDFLDYHRATLSPNRGMREAPVEICAKSVLERIVTGRIA